MGSRLGARRALVSLVVFGALAGCGDDSAVEVTATPVPTVSSATPEPSPTPTAPATAVPLPVMPPEMANNDAAGAEAAVRYFVALADYALATGDVSQWAAVTDDDCVFCQGISETVQNSEEEGLTRVGGRLTVGPAGAVDYREDSNLHLVEAVVEQESYRWVDSDGNVVEEDGATTGRVSFALQLRDGRWTLIAAGTTEDQES